MQNDLINKKALILDVNNLMYRNFFAHISESENDITALCYHSMLVTSLKYYREYKPDILVMAFDSPNSWRKIYTKSDLCLTPQIYKGNRKTNLTPLERKKLEQFDTKISSFAEIIKTYTNILVLQYKNLEADDLIAGYIQTHPNMSHILISSDKDFMQLLNANSLTIIDPENNKPRSLAEWDNDEKYFMFLKCFRGDKNDNVISAYPRLREKKIKEAYKDEYKFQNIINEELLYPFNKNGEYCEKKLRVGDVFEENNLLMNLYEQPANIRQMIDKCISEAYENRQKFNYVKFLKFCGKNQLQNIIDKIDSFVNMLAGK